jgi:protein-disulfide isomerase
LRLKLFTKEKHMLKPQITSDDHSQGNASAPVILVEYGDYECPYCEEAYPVVKRLQQEFGQELRFIFRNFPLQQIHPLALAAAETAEFANTKGMFWEMHDRLFETQQDLSPRSLLQSVLSFGLDGSAWEKEIAQKRFDDRIAKDFEGGVRSGVNGTPTFFINGVRHDGPSDFHTLRHAIATAAQLAQA